MKDLKDNVVNRKMRVDDGVFFERLWVAFF